MDWFSKFFKRWKCRLRKFKHCLSCSFGPKPPKGNPPTPYQKSNIEGYFPNLNTWSVTGPATGGSSVPGAYNCIAWSVGITDEWLWPGPTVDIFDEFYALHGWSVAANGKREYKKRKVALYATNSDPADCQHGSRETHDCGWDESKLGGLERIMHIRSELEGGSYGDVIRYYEKQDIRANLNLCKY
jgi:hypothetical protein